VSENAVQLNIPVIRVSEIAVVLSLGILKLKRKKPEGQQYGYENVRSWKALPASSPCTEFNT
jgi:hypothetical protein